MSDDMTVIHAEDLEALRRIERALEPFVEAWVAFKEAGQGVRVFVSEEDFRQAYLAYERLEDEWTS